MKIQLLVTIAATALFLSACSGGGSSSGDGAVLGSETRDFSTFVNQLFNDTNETAEPKNINQRDFLFQDNDAGQNDFSSLLP